MLNPRDYLYTLADEALTFEGAEAYHGATRGELALFLEAHPWLWTPAGDSTGWATLPGFSERLAEALKAPGSLDEAYRAFPMAA